MQSNETAVPIGIAIRADGVMTPIVTTEEAMQLCGVVFPPGILPLASWVPTRTALVMCRRTQGIEMWNDKAVRIVEDSDGICPPGGIWGTAVLVFVGSPSRQVYRELIAAYS